MHTSYIVISYISIKSKDLLQEACNNGESNRKKSTSKTEMLSAVIQKTVICQFYPLPNILTLVYIFQYCVLRMTYKRSDNHFVTCILSFFN